MKHKLLIAFVWTVVIGLGTPAAQAGLLGSGLGGALRGAIVGDLIDGRDGAKAGAIVGGLIGAGEAANRKKRQQQQREEAQRRQADWAAQQRAEQARIRQELAAPEEAVNQTLLVETQKSLIRLGFDPGDIGTPGSALSDAVKNYQRSQGLLETGELSQQLLAHLLRNGG